MWMVYCCIAFSMIVAISSIAAWRRAHNPYSRADELFRKYIEDMGDDDE